ncbi:hypothetical protein TrVE_jg8673 [Triparma verrucosa]|uniref:Brix domain-containing protein n=2 Tax=Triparma TaxID=722752 RepID=A0A9W7AXC0_9STRA|nr:hypothetical protein TrST_g9461 [Triparma strigata]GMH81194.1 hypothetical protein TrVE_jg8673 [Triparma verrucosa]|mmetsp:Transcript_29192/g.55143  ORF Transcript_29192/g.55143 Transcript_29192/m.55143 type:complete len:407 (+) Transcript_29192:173-1393(+)
MPKHGRKRKKTRTHVVEDETAASALKSTAPPPPRSMVVRHGSSSAEEPELSELVKDWRNLMSPATALKLKERKGAKIRDYAEMAPVLGVTHLLAFSMNEGGNVNCKVARVPSGPTLSFKVKRFSLAKQVRAVQKRPIDTSSGIFQTAPVVVTNNFGGAEESAHVKLMRITFQNMFPAVDVGKVKLSDVRRVVLFNLLKDEGEEVEVRHYAVRANPTGVNRNIKRIVQAKIPNLGKVNDIADYIIGNATGGALSDSEGEDEAANVVLPQKFAGRGNSKSQKSALKLVELGPRMRMKLMKVERGLASGDIMYHSVVTKTPEEAKKQKTKITERDALKRQRREEQEENVQRKKKAKEEKKEAKRLKREAREAQVMDELRGGATSMASNNETAEGYDSASDSDDNNEDNN